MTAPRPSRRGLVIILVLQLLMGLVLLGRAAEELNADGVAYCRVAHHLLAGRFALAINATWGPLYSWLMLPGLLVGLEPTVAARVVQLACALASTAGAWLLFGTLGLGEGARFILVLTTALIGATHSQAYLSADMTLVASVTWLSWALLEPHPRLLGLPRPFVAGLLAALAALARPIGLPLGGSLLVLTTAVRASAERSSALRATALAALGMAVLVLPWLTVLSLRYGRFTVSHSPAVVRAVLHPTVTHPWNQPSFTRLHRPRPGRITSWEDPAEVLDPALRWSPFESTAMWRHQVELCARNATAVRAHLAEVDGSGIAALAALLSPLLVVGAGWRAMWPFLLLTLTAVPLVPLHVEARYLWPAESALLGAVGLLWARLARRGALVGVLVGAVLFVPPLVMAAVHLAVRFAAPARHELRIARSWAETVRAAGASGPVASWTSYPDKALDPEGLYLAWTLGEPWLAHLGGAEDLPRATALGARVLVLKTAPAESAAPSWIRDDPSWRLLVTTEVRRVTARDGWYFVYVRSLPPRTRAPGAPQPSTRAGTGPGTAAGPRRGRAAA